MTVRYRCLILAFFLVYVALPAAAQQLRPGRLSKEERAALLQGLKLTFESSAGGAAVKDTRSARLAAVYVPEGASPTPLLPPGPFRAVLSGYLKIKLRGDFKLSLKGAGKVAIVFNDKEAIRAAGDDLAATPAVDVSLIKGYNKLHIEYESPAKGPALLRLYWAGDAFTAEPLPPPLISHNGADAEFTAGEALRHGRELIGRHHCFKCHAPDKAVDPAAAASMPELRRDAPSLAVAGDRLNAQWIAQWILNPGGLRNRTTMPRALAGLDAKAAAGHAADVAAYLTALPTTEKLVPVAGDRAQFTTGEALFEDRGCIACHRFTPLAEEDDYDRLSLHFAAAKYRPGALRAFLLDSRKHYRWSRMPKFTLTDEEAAALAAFVRASAKGKLAVLPDNPKGDVARGKMSFDQLRCHNCHSVSGDGATRPAALAALARGKSGAGCLAETPKPGSSAPHFGFTKDDRAALAAFLATDRSSLARTVAEEFSRRQFAEIRCNACHTRDLLDADLAYVLQDESSQGHPPEPIPNLTWAGDKLRPEWTLKLFSGTLPYRPRPHFKARMPVFPTRAKLLSAGFTAEHGFAPQEDEQPKFSADLARQGAGLAAMDSGLSCNRCHPIGDRQPIAPFDARSTNLDYAVTRLRYDYYRRWMLDPQRIDPTTRMLKFSPDGQKTGLKQFFDGDARQQFDALWHYLHTLHRARTAKNETTEAGR